MATIVTTGARNKLYWRILCLLSILEDLDAQLQALEERHDECCEPYQDGITMGGTFVHMGGEDDANIIGMSDNP